MVRRHHYKSRVNVKETSQNQITKFSQFPQKMLHTSASFVIIIAGILKFANVEANPKEVKVSAYCKAYNGHPFPVYQHVREHIENCEKLGYVQKTVNAEQDINNYYEFVFLPPQNSPVGTSNKDKCTDYRDDKDEMLENVLSECQKASEVAEQDIISPAEIWSVPASSILNAYIKMMKRELDEYTKFYDDNGKDEQLGKLLDTYRKIHKDMEAFISNYFQQKSNILSIIDGMGNNLVINGMRNELITFVMRRAQEFDTLIMNENKKLEKRVQTITKVNEDLEKRVQRMEEGNKTIQNIEEKWSYGPRKEKKQ